MQGTDAGMDVCLIEIEILMSDARRGDAIPRYLDTLWQSKKL
jgi:hypothetical protein